ncbi:DUF72 domain-containing protein [Flindersiella endophytica]
MPVRVGTSGWSYQDWRGPFYPGDLPQRLWLEHYATRFSTVELNNAFYRLPGRDTFEGWRDKLPAGFVVAVKGSRYLTHIKRLRDPAEPVHRLVEHARGLGARLGPFLLQLPPTLRSDAGLLDACLAEFPARTRVAVEPRHESWWEDAGAVRPVLERHDAALCWADRLGRPVTPLWRTASWGYVRLHEGRAKPWPHYGRAALESWAQRVTDTYEDTADVYAYFNNDPGCAAVANADTFVGLLLQRGTTVQ